MPKTSIPIPLPTLPKQIRGQEAAFGIEFRRWWEKHSIPGNFELKHTKGAQSLSFAAVEIDQVHVGTMAYSRSGILLRVTVGTPGAPDYIGQTNQITWIVIRYPAAFHIISLEAFLMEKKRSTRKSLTSERAESIATITVHT